VKRHWLNGVAAYLSFVAGDSLQSSVMQLIQEENRLEREKDFNAWCDFLASLPEDFEPKVKGG
jgi:hypothetical protein